MKILFSKCHIFLYNKIGTKKILSLYDKTTSVYTPRSSGGLFVFVALRPMSTAMVIVGRSVHLTTLFPGHA